MYFSSLNLSPNLKERITRVSLLKSSLFSARIEGNLLELSDFDSGNKEDLKKLEIFNITDGINLINSKVKKGKLKKDLLLNLHACILQNLSPDAGCFREEASAIFNQAGIPIYINPKASDIHSFLKKMFLYINSEKEKFPIITAFITHLIFEKIHPFLDGNGRVGRLLIQATLKAKGWNVGFTIPFEEYLDEHKNEYYFHLDKGFKETNEYLIFMLEAFLSQLEKIKVQIEEEKEKKEPFLPPRQEEILNIIKDQKVVSFDMIRRRFLKIPERTLRYDLKKLVGNGLVETSGQTKGRYYRIISSSTTQHEF